MPGQRHWQNKMERMQHKMDWMRSRMGGNPWSFYAPSSGNRAFDDYRAETLRRLEDEQREFREFLARLRLAKDKTEFDQFMAERGNRPDGESAARLISLDYRNNGPPTRAAARYFGGVAGSNCSLNHNQRCLGA